jgi:hypothetical protein
MLVLPLPSLRGKGGNKKKQNNKKGPKLQANKAKVDEKLKGKCFHCKNCHHKGVKSAQ